jgi:hypothetical protein
MAYEIELKGKAVEMVEDADAYAQEGVLSTFFRSRDGRAVLDCWAKRLASYRTADITRIRWLANVEEGEEQFHRRTVHELMAS